VSYLSAFRAKRTSEACFDVENVGSQFLSLRQLLHRERCLGRCEVVKIATFCGAFKANLCIAASATRAVGVLYWPFFSRPLDCRDSVRTIENVQLFLSTRSVQFEMSFGMGVHLSGNLCREFPYNFGI
jgi:hypothetical protein